MKKTVLFLLAMCICLTLSLPAFADGSRSAAEDAGNREASVERAEQTEWRYRVYNGQPQKRLWSITYERWLTDWMPL